MRKLIKFCIKTLCFFFGLLICLWIVALAFLQMKPVQTWVVNFALNSLEESTGIKVEASQVEFVFPLSVRFKQLRCQHDGSIFLTINQLNATCTYGALLEGRLILSMLSAEGITLLKKPQLYQPTRQFSPAWEGQSFPFYFKIENIFLDNIQVDSSLFSEAPFKEAALHSTFSLKGFISNNPFRKGLYSHLNLRMHDTSSNVHPIMLLLHVQCHMATLTLEGNHLPRSLSKLVQLDSKFHVTAEAPIHTWYHFLVQNSNQTEDIQGSFKSVLQPVATNSLTRPLLHDLTHVEGSFSLNDRTGLTLNETSLKNNLIELKTRAHIANDTSITFCHFEGHSQLSNHPSHKVQGQLNFNGNLAGSIEHPSITVHALSSELNIHNKKLKNIIASFHCSREKNQFEGDFNLDFDYNSQPCHLASLFESTAQQMSISHLELYGLSAHITADITLNLMAHRCKGDLQAHIYDLSEWSFLLEEPTTFAISSQETAEQKAADVKDRDEGIALAIAEKRSLSDAPLQPAGLSDEIRKVAAKPMTGEAFLDLHLFPSEEQKQIITGTFITNDFTYQDLHLDHLFTTLQLHPSSEPGKFLVTSETEGKNFVWNQQQIKVFNFKTSHLSDLSHSHIQNLSLVLNADGLNDEQVSIKELSVYTFLPYPRQVLQGELKFAVRQLLPNLNHVSPLIVQYIEGETHIDETTRDWPFSLHGSGSGPENWDMSLIGNWSWHTSSFYNIHINELFGMLGPYPYQLLNPIEYTQEGESTTLSHLSLQLRDAIFETHFDKQHDLINWEFSSNQIPTELFHFVSPTFPLTGRVSLKGSLKGSLSNPAGQFDVQLHHVQFAEELFSKKPFMEGHLQFQLHDQGIGLKSAIHGIGKNPLIAEGSLPLKLTLSPFNLSIDAHIPFSVNLDAEGELDPYLHLFYNDVTNITGHTKIALNLSGKMDNPHIQGTIDLFNGSFESLDTGATYRDINAHFEGEGSAIVLKEFNAFDKRKGSIKAHGEIKLDKELGFPFEFKISPSQIYIVDSDYMSIVVSGPLILSGNCHQAVLNGDLVADSATVHLEQALPKQIKRIDVTYVNLDESEPHPLRHSKGDESIHLNLNLKLPGNVKIEGKNFTSEWKGNLAVTGTPDFPLLNGDIRALQGRYDFNGKEFLLSQGNIHFAGDPAKKTSLYVIAGKDFDRIHAEIIVKGPTTKPVVSFHSNPPLSQREVLSYILFNRGIADITSDQGDRLSQSFIELNDNDNSSSPGKDFLTRLRNNIGIDRLDITSSDGENKDVSLQVGKYITEKVFVSINKSINDVGNRVAIEANLQKNLKAQAEVEIGGDTQGKVSLKWKKDY